MNNAFIKTLQRLLASKNLMTQLLDKLPFPFELFSPDGKMVFANRAWLELNEIHDTGLLTAQYDILNDPVYNDQENLKDGINKAFCGESSVIHDVALPIHSQDDFISTVEKQFGKAYTDIYLYPLIYKGKPAYVVFISLIKSIYKGRNEIALAKEYMLENWLLDFDLKKIAESSGLSIYHFSRLFKKNTGVTPFLYYKQIKINKLKEKLLDLNLSISGAFDTCGVDYNGNNRLLFKQMTGVTPVQYRNDMLANKKKQ